jgi:glyoxylase-like metal-dependent hydrolase (beta-lactamase superfamily II)
MGNHTLPLEIAKIDDATYRIEDNGTRCFFFIVETRALLVDTGRGKAGSLRAAIESLTDKPILLVNSHGDWDHIGQNAEFDMAYMHPADMANYFSLAAPGAPVAPLWEGDLIDIGGRTFEVVLIPGHSPGSIALLDRKHRILLVGDSVSGPRPMMMHGEKRSIDALILSLEKLLGLIDAFDTIYPAHGAFPLGPETVEQTLVAAKKLRAGALTPHKDLPRPELPDAKLYESDGAAFIF